MELKYTDGQTPIDEEEKLELRIKSISTMAELDEFEQQNIEEAMEWMLARNFKPEDVVQLEFILSVHKRMFHHVWKWAGMFRNTDKNLGVPFYKIRQELQNLIEDCKFWIIQKTYSNEEISIRFKHRLVSIHLFPNGNGRHSRLMADILLKSLDTDQTFTWGNKSLRKGDERSLYLHSLKKADNGDIKPLLKFSKM
ncbi:MAG: mobile mystery protein B [Lewinellaceae bacterium]|nr:mobile mystery protein B [Saprospiraceae bacterium]MCB9343517.1 mobile mystery protein B [Lewinellaceae bacterium]